MAVQQYEHPVRSLSEIADGRKVSRKIDIDWIDIGVALGRTTKGEYLQRKLLGMGLLGVTFVRPLNRGEGGAASVFAIRLQDPGSFKSISDVIACTEQRVGSLEATWVDRVEFSCDTFIQGASIEELAEAGAACYQLARHRPNSDPRRLLYRSAERVQPIKRGTTPNLLKEHLAAGWALGAGHRDPIPGQDNSVYCRMYVKTTDTVGSSRIEVEPRIRNELTYSGEGVGQIILADSIEDWQALRFEKTPLIKGLHARKFRPDLSDNDRRKFGYGIDIGLDGSYLNPETGKPNKAHPVLCADSEMNDLTYQAARRLTKRWLH